MKICHVLKYTAPARDAQGTQRVLEAIARQQKKDGHEIYLYINKDSVTDIGTIVGRIPIDCDVVHYHAEMPSDYGHFENKFPWIATPQGGGTDTPDIVEKYKDYCSHFVFVSRFCANIYNSNCFIHNCADPKDFIFRDKKDDYFLWIGSTDWGDQKGIGQSILIAKKMGLKLKIAGGGKNQSIIDCIKSNCTNKIEYLGFVNGKEKAELIAGARGLFMLGLIPDACPVTVIECLASGVPIIASPAGALPEMVNEKVGFICNNIVELQRAVANIGKIKSQDCRDRFFSVFSPKVVSDRYISVYRNVIDYGDVRKGSNE
jgi:glycosyltransferase involved in cell wall biosynthesis